ncbi:MAG: polysaccharide deacetylase family protein [Acidobacteriota bacterium]
MSLLIKTAVSVASRSRVVAKFVTLLEHWDQNTPNLLRVLTYHRVDWPDPGSLLYPRGTVAPDVFDQHMRHLSTRYRVLSMAELVDCFRRGRTLPPRAVLLTFDDAYRDFSEHAWPILKRYRLPATLFVPTTFPGQPGRMFWWDRLHQALHSTLRRDLLSTPWGRFSLKTARQRDQSFNRLKGGVESLPHQEAMGLVEEICFQLDAPSPRNLVLSWSALRRLAGEGVSLAAHSRTHPLMDHISWQEARDEVTGSMRDLELQVGPVLPVFAYPGGRVTDRIVRLLAREGFLLAFTTEPGINFFPPAHRLRLRRINIGSRTALTTLRAQLLKYSEILHHRSVAANIAASITT